MDKIISYSLFGIVFIIFIMHAISIIILLYLGEVIKYPNIFFNFMLTGLISWAMYKINKVTL